MARLKVPAIAFGLLLFTLAIVAGILIVALGNGFVGAAWVLASLLGFVVLFTAVAVIRGRNTGRADEP